jgi:predicted ABC-type sugar transport system permease subunit
MSNYLITFVLVLCLGLFMSADQFLNPVNTSNAIAQAIGAVIGAALVTFLIFGGIRLWKKFIYPTAP